MYDRTPGYDGRIDPRSFHYRNAPDLPEAARQRVVAQYKAKVTFVDKWFGMLLDALDETGLAENTALILTADHGTNVGDRYRPDIGGRTAGAVSASQARPERTSRTCPLSSMRRAQARARATCIVQPQDMFRTVMALAGHEDATPTEIESYDVLKLAQEGSDGRRDLALGGSTVASWQDAGPDKVLFSAFDRTGGWASPPTQQRANWNAWEPRTTWPHEHPNVVERLRAAAIDEIAHRGLDPALLAWLRAEGQDRVPDDYRVTDANPLPPGLAERATGSTCTRLQPLDKESIATRR